MHIRWPGSSHALPVVRPRTSLYPSGPPRPRAGPTRSSTGQHRGPSRPRCRGHERVGPRVQPGREQLHSGIESRHPGDLPLAQPSDPEAWTGLSTPSCAPGQVARGPLLRAGPGRAHAARAASPGSRTRSATRGRYLQSPHPGVELPGSGTRCVCAHPLRGRPPVRRAAQASASADSTASMNVTSKARGRSGDAADRRSWITSGLGRADRQGSARRPSRDTAWDERELRTEDHQIAALHDNATPITVPVGTPTLVDATAAPQPSRPSRWSQGPRSCSRAHSYGVSRNDDGTQTCAAWPARESRSPPVVQHRGSGIRLPDAVPS
jgi:hypothetical protein